MSYAKGRWIPRAINIVCPHCEELLMNPCDQTRRIDRRAFQATVYEPLAVVRCTACGESYRLPEITRKLWKGEMV